MLNSLRNFDWVLFIGLMVLAAASLVSLASSGVEFFWRQLIWYVLAFVIILGSIRLDWRGLIGQSWFRYGLYWFSIALLIVAGLQSETLRGTKSWLVFGNFQFEPVELVKVALILVLAGFFSRRHIAAWHGKNFFISLMYALFPAILIALQPDFGSAVVIVGTWIGFLLMSGVNKKRLAYVIIIMLLIVGILWMFFLKPYQKDRIFGFINPQLDPLGVNYNVIQSKIAIGSAGFWGKGFGAGTQTQLDFLPEPQTDFLFAAFIEEWGLFGGFVILLTFLLIIFRVMSIGIRASNNDAKFIVLGTGSVLVIHFFINVGSTMGLVPVTGINFPFLSYGGSSILTIAVLISIIERIRLESR